MPLDMSTLVNSKHILSHLFVYMLVCATMRLCVCACMRVGIHMWMDGWMDVQVYVCARIFMCISMHVRMSICVDRYVHEVHMFNIYTCISYI